MSSNALMLEMRKKKTSHLFHLLMAVITGGVWIIIWVMCIISNWSENKAIDKQINRVLANETVR